MPETQKPGNYAPWDRNQFLDRLGTFRNVESWASKPDEINEAQWAKRGWTCVGAETVGCIGGCGKQLLISLEPSEESEDQDYEWREEAQKELVSKYTEMIVSAHEKGCPWRDRGCDGMSAALLYVAFKNISLTTIATIHRLPLANQAKTLHSLKERYESLCEISSELPSNVMTPQGLNVFKLVPHIFSTLYPDAPRAASGDHPSSPTARTSSPPTKSADHPTINIRALTLAVLGWQGDTDYSISGIATCPTCFRRLGLWLFKSPYSSSMSPATSPPQSPIQSRSPAATSATFSDRSESIINRLDPIGEHREYCPWVNAKAQSRDPPPGSTEEQLPGWEILRKMIMNHRPAGATGSKSPPTGAGPEGATSESEVKTTEEKDKERWARLRRLKKVFKFGKKPQAAEK
ncbi:MAG: hypothetical protein Q9202_002701 [Teloschistes flavicans]